MAQIQLVPFINFADRAREAMEHYQRALGGQIDLQLDDSGERVISARLEADGVVIVGSDGHPDYPAQVGENIALVLSGTDKARLTAIFDILADGGIVKMPLMKQAWGNEMGWLADKFGVNWNVTIQPE